MLAKNAKMAEEMYTAATVERRRWVLVPVWLSQSRLEVLNNTDVTNLHMLRKMRVCPHGGVLLSCLAYLSKCASSTSDSKGIWR